MSGDGLNPTQQRVLTEVMATGQARPGFEPELARRLRSDLEDGLAAIAGALVEDRLVVHKTALTRVHTCEGHHVAEAEAGFAWSAATAVGAVTHKAIELSVGFREPRPLADLVDSALDRLAADPDRGPGPWLATASPVEVAELRAGAMERASKFEDEFPPIPARWRPRLDTRLSASLCDDRILLVGKPDLALGQARGRRAGVLVVDFKTGLPARSHADDLRFYALLETLRAGVPPFRVATWYLDSASCRAEDVDEEVLAVAARRVVDGAHKLYQLMVERRPPRLQPGPACAYCSARHACPAVGEGSGHQSTHSSR